MGRIPYARMPQSKSRHAWTALHSYIWYRHLDHEAFLRRMSVPDPQHAPGRQAWAPPPREAVQAAADADAEARRLELEGEKWRNKGDAEAEQAWPENPSRARQRLHLLAGAVYQIATAKPGAKRDEARRSWGLPPEAGAAGGKKA